MWGMMMGEVLPTAPKNPIVCIGGIWYNHTLPDMTGECGSEDTVTGLRCNMTPAGSMWHEETHHRYREDGIEFTWPLETHLGNIGRALSSLFYIPKEGADNAEEEDFSTLFGPSSEAQTTAA